MKYETLKSRLAGKEMERVRGLEPPLRAWKAIVLPLHHTRALSIQWSFPAFRVKFFPDCGLGEAGRSAQLRVLRAENGLERRCPSRNSGMHPEEFPLPSLLSKYGQATAVIFPNQRSAADPAGYGKTAERMLELAAAQPGYLGVESVRDEQGRGITISYWKDRASALAWKSQAEHARAQKRGRDHWYNGYVVRIATLTSEYGLSGHENFESSDSGGPRLWARYNAWANHRLLKSTAALHENHYDVEIGRKTVRGLWNHMIATDLMWLRRFRQAIAESSSLSVESGEVNEEDETIKETEPHQSLEEMERARRSLDQEIIEFFDSGMADRIPGPLSYVSSLDGKSRAKDVRTLLFHFFNHQTFHRGQLTVVLRQLGVASEMTDIVWME